MGTLDPTAHVCMAAGEMSDHHSSELPLLLPVNSQVPGDSGFVGSSPQPSTESGDDEGVEVRCPFGDVLQALSHRVRPSAEASTTVTPTTVGEPRSAVERAMERLRVKMSAFSLERCLVAAAAREQWRGKLQDPLTTWAAGVLAQRLRGLDERLEACSLELEALGVARKILMEADSSDSGGLLSSEPDSLQAMTSGDGVAPAPSSPTPSTGRVDAAVLLHLERRAHRDTKRQLRELRKRYDVLRDEMERVREARKHNGSRVIRDLAEEVSPPKDAAREICRLQAALLQLERVRDELTAQNKALKTQLAELAARTSDPATTYQLEDSSTHFKVSTEPPEHNRLRRKSTYKVIHSTQVTANSPEISSPIDQELAEARDRLAASERLLAAREVEIARREAELRAAEAVAQAEASRLSVENARLFEDCNRERVARKRCHSQLQALRGKVRVFCRVRPGAPPGTEGCVLAPSDPFTLSVLAKPGSPSLRSPPTSTTQREFCFDRVFQPNDSQEKVFQETSELLSSVMDGYNVCICAYGQTGTGKTHTILGSAAEPGLAPRTFTRLFELAHEVEARCEVRVSAYVLELYNDRLVDLLRPADSTRDASERLEIRRDREGVVWVQGAAVVDVSDAAHLHQLFSRAIASRHTSCTRLNAASSRSHLLIGVRVETSNRITGAVLRGKVSLLDLAGSERVSRSGAVDEQLREASSINKSLAALGDVISALAADQPFVPYRNSKLTMLLQDSLGGNAKTLMFATVSPDACDLEETITSLTYATRVRQITNTAKRAAESREIARLKQVIERLKHGDRLDNESPTEDRSTSS